VIRLYAIEKHKKFLLEVWACIGADWRGERGDRDQPIKSPRCIILRTITRLIETKALSPVGREERLEFELTTKIKSLRRKVEEVKGRSRRN
jgi:hypothetical protein